MLPFFCVLNESAAHPSPVGPLGKVAEQRGEKIRQPLNVVRETECEFFIASRQNVRQANLGH
jgi:hypothetical protein